MACSRSKTSQPTKIFNKAFNHIIKYKQDHSIQNDWNIGEKCDINKKGHLLPKKNS